MKKIKKISKVFLLSGDSIQEKVMGVGLQKD